MSDPRSIANIREKVRQLLRGRTIESIVEELHRGDIQLVELMEELYLYRTEFKLQQEALRESQVFNDQALARFAQLFHSLPVPALVLATNGTLKDYNKAARDTLALDCRLFSQLAAREDAAKLDTTMQEARKHGHATRSEVKLRSARYETLIADIGLLQLPALDGKEPEIICTVLDQTDRIRQRKALVATAEVVDASTTVAVRWEAKPGWPLVYASDNVRHWGFPVQAFASGYVHLIDLVHPEDRDRVERAFSETAGKRQSHFTLTCRFIWADNSVHWVELESSTKRIPGIFGPCYQGLIRDVTEREQAQAALHQQLRFQELTAEMSALFANSLREELDAKLEEALACIGRFAEVDRCYLHQCRSEEDQLRPTCSWWSTEGATDPERRARIDTMALEGWSTRLANQTHISIPDVMKLPPEEEALRSELTLQLIRSRLILPLRSAGQLIGVLGLDTLRKARAWTDEEIRLLRLLSETLASMLVRQRIEAERQSSETRYQHLSASMSDVAYSSLKREGGRYQIDWITDSVETLTGYAADELIARGGWASLVLLEDRQTFVQRVLELEPGATTNCELRLRHRDGATRWVRVTTECLRDPQSPESTRLYGGLVDITERKTRETELKRLALLVEQSPSIVVMTDLSGHIEYVNARFSEVTGYTSDEVRGSKLLELSADAGPASPTWQTLWQTLRQGETWRGEIASRTKSGQRLWEQALVTPLRDEQGVISHIVKLGEDVSDKKALTERLTYLIHHDPLTGLPNRTLMRERIGRALARAKRDNHGVALLSIDLDKLKLINDSLGHNAGDQLLREVAQRLQGLLGKRDTLARFGGDNFVLLINRLEQAQDSVALAEQVRAKLDQPIALAKDTTRITGSIGIALYPEDSETAEELLNHADAALHQAQAEGGRLSRFYTPELNGQLLEQFQLEQALRHGLEHDELLLYYQPRVDIRSGEILSLEALVRWNHPDWGLIEPGRFIPLAESTGLILELGPVVLKAACKQIKAWQASGVPVVPIAVNLSAKELYQDALSAKIEEIMADASVDPQQLEIEITESATMHSVNKAVEILSSLRSLGLALAMDDFGTGHASLSYLNQLPMQTIKIDRSFLVKIDVHTEEPAQQGATIVKAIIGLGLNLGLKIIAEGVETLPQRDFLIEHGCDVAQGHLFSLPLPADKIEPLLRAGSVPTTLH
ncbi:EAL domain-containing protein [Thiorhodococcus mannitoliphagus]|uniref:EAL domain-containing protein n=2 Tax=Thiorhodococcus mannitoliphagus TaxID=329406 RepID=A0A6P1DTN4_9GAMM|nr:EAL domain-containing protein [Thiorhodococcus mannitoliphagus]